MVKKFQKYFFWIERVILRRIEPIDDSNNFIPSHSQSKSRIFGENLILGIWGSKRGQIDLRPSQIDFSRNFEPDRLFISKTKISIRATFIWISPVSLTCQFHGFLSYLIYGFTKLQNAAETRPKQLECSSIFIKGPCSLLSINVFWLH